MNDFSFCFQRTGILVTLLLRYLGLQNFAILQPQSNLSRPTNISSYDFDQFQGNQWGVLCNNAFVFLFAIFGYLNKNSESIDQVFGGEMSGKIAKSLKKYEENNDCPKTTELKLKHSTSISTNNSETLSFREQLSEISISIPMVPQLKHISPPAFNQSFQFNQNYNTITNFKVMEAIGRGSFGTVYRCIFLPDSHEVALKVINFNEFQDEYQENARNFYQNQVSVLKKLRAKSGFRLTCEFYGAFHHQGSGYIVMQLLQGFSLEELIQSDFQLSIEELKFYLAWLLLFLEQLHNEVECIHRDIKPENLMILSNGELVLLDFGCAKALKKNERTSSITGTCEYFSPSRFKCNYGAEADIWAFGVTAYELATKKLPFSYPQIQESLEQEKITKLSSVVRKKANMRLHQLDQYDSEFQEMIEDLFNSIFEEKLESSYLEQVKKCRFFSQWDWNKLRTNKLKPPRTFSLKEIYQIKQSPASFDDF